MTETMDRKDVIKEFKDAVNMTPTALKKWLDSDESKEVGDSHTAGGDGGESTGHKMGRTIITLLGKKQADLTDTDLKHMQKVAGYVKRHMAQKPKGDVSESKWRYSLMNWGHDPLKK